MEGSTSVRDRLNREIGRLNHAKEWCFSFLAAQALLSIIFLALGLAGLVSPETSGIGTVSFAVIALITIVYGNIIQRRIRCKEAELVALLKEQNLKSDSLPSKGMVIGTKRVVAQTKQLSDATRGGKEIRKSSGQMFRK